MANVNFVGHLVTCQANPFGVDDNHVISAVNVRSEVGFVFAANQACDLAGQPTEYFTLSVNHNPFLLHRFFVGRDGFVTERIHCMETNWLIPNYLSSEKVDPFSNGSANIEGIRLKNKWMAGIQLQIRNFESTTLVKIL